MDQRIENIVMKREPTFWANIYVGLKDTDLSKTAGIDVVYPMGIINAVCREYCDETGFCVSVTPTTFYYTNGNEKGAIVGIINYPRFPQSATELKIRAIYLAEELRKACDQYRVTVVMPDETIMVCRPNTKD